MNVQQNIKMEKIVAVEAMANMIKKLKYVAPITRSRVLASHCIFTLFCFQSQD
jgi:hypothetical protein